MFRKIGNEISQRQRTEKILRSHCISSLFTSETLCRKCRTQTNPIHCLLYGLNSSSFQICLDSVMEHFDLSLTTISFLHFALDGCTQIIILFSSSSLMLMKTDGFFFSSLFCFVFWDREKNQRLQNMSLQFITGKMQRGETQLFIPEPEESRNQCYNELFWTSG